MKGDEECCARIAVRPGRRSARIGRHMATGVSGAGAAGGASMSGPLRCLNRLQLPTDVVFLIVLWRLRMKLSLRDLAEILLLRGLVFSHEAIRDWEARLAPLESTRNRGSAPGDWQGVGGESPLR